jgi:hypothetical protein
MALFLHLTLGIDQYQWMVVSMQDGLFTQNVAVPLLECMYQDKKTLVINVVIDSRFCKSL